MKKFFGFLLMVIVICMPFKQNVKDLRDVSDFFKKKHKPTQEELYERIRKRYTDPIDPPAMNLNLTAADIEKIRANGLGSNRCVTCKYHGDDPNMY